MNDWLRAGGVTRRAAMLWRAVFGLYFAWTQAMLLPYVTELFTTEGILVREGFALAQAPAVTLALLATTSCGLLIASGQWVRVASAVAWFTTMNLMYEQGVMRAPEQPLIHMLLVFLALTPFTTVEGRDARGPLAGHPPLLRGALWFWLAVSYASAGWSKLNYGDSAWHDGSALSAILQSSAFRRTFYGDLFAQPWTIPLTAMGTWFTVFLESGMLLWMCFRIGRVVAFLSSVMLHALALVVFNLTEVSLGMLIVHGYLWSDGLRNDTHELWLNVTAWRRRRKVTA
jgi:hypothetical protein